MTSMRTEVLRLYRSLLRKARAWEALDPKDTPLERRYILTEAAEKFRAAKKVCPRRKPTLATNTALADTRDRIEITAYYNIPFPRPTTTFRLRRRSTAAERTLSSVPTSGPEKKALCCTIIALQLL